MLTNETIETPDQAKRLICELGRRFYDLGWVSGTGGGISIRLGDTIFMAPSGVQKEALTEDSIFELDEHGEVTAGPDPASGYRVSECRPLFLHAFHKRGAGAVIHSHSPAAALSTLAFADAFRVTHLEMIKGLAGHGYADVAEVPIIENTARECDLADSLGEAMDAYPKAHAILVRRHGVYVWGDDWKAAKRHAECYDYLFGMAVAMKKMGIAPDQPPA